MSEALMPKRSVARVSALLSQWLIPDSLLRTERWLLCCRCKQSPLMDFYECQKQMSVS